MSLIVLLGEEKFEEFVKNDGWNLKEVSDEYYELSSGKEKHIIHHYPFDEFYTVLTNVEVNNFSPLEL